MSLVGRPYSPGDWRRTELPSDRARGRRRARHARRLVRALLVLAVAGVLMGGIVLAVLLAWVSRDLPDPSRLISRAVPQSTTITDRTGRTVLYELHGAQQRTRVALDAIAPTARWATIAVEDKRFYEHGGFRLQSLIRALLVNVLHGGAAQGGSTITQQLIKNAILSPEKTYRRKLKELLLAERLEQKFSKDEILTMYFNEIPYGSTAYGIEAAAKMYFGKSAHDLDLAEAAFLAAIPKAPTYYSPYGSHRDELAARTRFVLDLMAEQGYITREEAAAGKRVDVLARVKPKREAITAPHFVMAVRELLTEQFGERVVEQGGLTVTTTLDLDRQKDAEAAIAKVAPRNAKQYGASNAALVAIDVPTGQILAMVGSKDYFDATIDGQVNVALRPRQPGSSFKPIVYATAFAAGYTTETLLEDVATTFPTPVGAYEPADYDGKERGLVTARHALAGSLNIPAVKMLSLAGIDRVLDTATRLGYTTLQDRSRFGLALVLGGGEVKLLEHTAAYAALAADGVRRPTNAILTVADRSGNVLWEWHAPADERALDAEPVRALTSILTDNDARAYIFGAHSPLAFSDRLVAAKTGTTNDWRDAWTMGFTPSLAVGVWVGNNDNHPMKRGSDGSIVAAPIWRAFMDAALKGKPAEPFPPPQPIPEDLKPVLRGIAPPVTHMRVDRTTGQPATDATPPDQVEERVQQSLHTILQYVRRDDPRGPPPERPEDDPMFRPWEDALRVWGMKQGITVAAPVADDPLRTEANRPTIEVTAPVANTTLAGREFAIEGHASAPRGVTRVDVRVDGIPAAILALDHGTFHGSVHIPAVVGRGSRTITAVAYDDMGNAREAAVPVTVAADREPIALAWESPAANATLHAADFPATLTITGADAVGTTRLDVRITDADGDHLLASVVPPGSGPARILWPRPPAPGLVQLRAALLVHDEVVAETAPRPITIAK